MFQPTPFDPDATVRAFHPGQRMFGRYQLTQLLGRGTIGVVWLAKDEMLGGAVALKLLPEMVVFDAVAISDLKRETQRSLQLTHPHIVRIHDFWEEAGRAAISMEYVDGSTLARTRLQEPGRVFSPQTLLPYVEQLAEALEYAHTRARVVHRDLKPANLLINHRGELKVADFGIADTLTESATRLSRPLPGASGSPPYMSPQQMLGEKPSISDDIYSLGATIYELLTSKPPLYSGNIFAQAQGKVPPPMHERRHELLGDAAKELPPIPRSWELTVAACLAKEPAQRPPGATAVAECLAEKTKRTVRAPSAPPARDRGTLRKPRPHFWRSGLFHVAGLAGTAALASVFWGDEVSDSLGRWNRALARGLSGAVTPAAASTAAPDEPAPAAAVDPAFPPPPFAEMVGAGAVARESDTAVPLQPLTSEVVAAEAPSVPVSPASPLDDSAAVEATAYTTAAPSSWTLHVEPADVGARVWIGPLADRVVPESGQLEFPELPAGDHELVVQAPGYQPLLMKVTYDPAQRPAPAIARLVPVRGALEVFARPGSTVSVTANEGPPRRLGEVPDDGRLEVNDLLRVGTYDLLIEHPECAPVVVNDVAVRIGRTATARAQQALLPGELRIFTVPFGAEVLLDGVSVGLTPATLPGQPSATPLTVEVRASGYRSVVEEVTLRPNEVRYLTLPALVPAAGHVRLQFDLPEVDPDALTITVDGRPVRGAAGLLTELDVGEHTIAISHPDYEPWNGSVQVKDETVTDLPVVLFAKPAVLDLVSTPAGASVRLTGGELLEAFCEDEQGRELLTPFQGTVPAGDYTVTFHLPDHAPVVRRVTVGANETLPISARFQPTRWPEEGRLWVVPELDLAMAWMPPGDFTLGSPPGEAGRFHNEGPQTRVTLARGFWLGRTEVTQREWERLMGNNRSDHRGADLPVTNVSWNDAMAFCRKLTDQERRAGRLPEGFVYTLPTEVQWEYAARAGTTTRYHSGDRETDLARVGWYSENSDGRARPVAQKSANTWGLHDMHGNVWEWALSWTRTYPGGAVTADAVPPRPGQVLRGGSWLSSANFNRSAIRSGTAGTRYGVSVIGFRVALTEKLDRPFLASGD